MPLPHLGAKVGPLPLWGWGAGAAAIATPFMLKGRKGKKGGGDDTEGGGRGGGGGRRGGAGYMGGEPTGGFNPYGSPYSFGGGSPVVPAFGGFGVYPGFGGLFDRGYGGRGHGERGYERTGYHDHRNVWGGGGLGMHHRGDSMMEGRGLMHDHGGIGSLFYRGPMGYSGRAFSGLTGRGYAAEAFTGNGLGRAGESFGGPGGSSGYNPGGILDNNASTPGASQMYSGIPSSSTTGNKAGARR